MAMRQSTGDGNRLRLTSEAPRKIIDPMPREEKIVRHLKPPVVGFGLVAIAALLHLALKPASPGPLHCVPCGTALGSAGALILIWSLAAFVRRRTSPVPGSRPNALVVDGPYRFSRNPMYVAAAMLLSSVTCFMGSLPFLIPPIGFILVMNFLYIPHEERRMAESFGDSYDAYRARVRRWI